MSARVPVAPPSIDPTTIRSGKAVLGTTWKNAAFLSNWLSGRGGVLVPSYYLGTVSQGATHTLRYRVKPRYEALDRIWVVNAHVGSTVQSTITLSSDGATSDAFPVQQSSTLVQTFYLVAPVTSRTSSETEISLQIEAGAAADVVVTSVACYEVPRVVLDTSDAADNPVDVDTCAPGQPVYYGANQSIAGVAVAARSCLTHARRNSLFQWAVDTSSSLLFTTTSTTGVELFVRPPILLDRYLYSGDTTKKATVKVYARATTQDGTVRVIMANGDSLSITVTATGSYAWWPAAGTSEVDVHAEDLTTADGLRSSTWDIADWDAWVTSGGTLDVASISVMGVDQ